MAMVERRREPRIPAGALIQFLPDGSDALVDARMIDRSEHGFRAAHQCLALSAGQEVWFRDGNRVGKARVIWNQLLGHTTESGFMILSH